MKYLQDYMEARQSQLFEETDSFFAFSQKQFDEGKKEGIKYVQMGGGMFTNQKHVEKVINGLERIYKESIEQDIADHGYTAIIRRELSNHEAYYTGDITSTVEALEGYKIPTELIRLCFRDKTANVDELIKTFGKD